MSQHCLNRALFRPQPGHPDWSAARRAPLHIRALYTYYPFPPRSNTTAQLDPVKRLFLDNICKYSTKTTELLFIYHEYDRALLEEVGKLQRLYGGSYLSQFPEF
uniref:ATP synthase peripheral stalk subunit F6, mitochondrial n=1 Tax=Esox lucius TaxID=8010 RepID=A0A3P8YZ12_ESOLU